MYLLYFLGNKLFWIEIEIELMLETEYSGFGINTMPADALAPSR